MMKITKLEIAIYIVTIVYVVVVVVAYYWRDIKSFIKRRFNYDSEKRD